MAYEKHTWETGEVITAENLNHMENGIKDAGGSFAISVQQTDNALTLTKTWQEIFDAVNGGKFAYVIEHRSDTSVYIYPVNYVSVYGLGYDVNCNNTIFTATSATGYPTFDTSNAGGGN